MPGSAADLALVGVFVGTLFGVPVGPLAAAPASALGAAPAALAPLVQGGVIPPPWRVVTLPRQAVSVTRYSAETVDGREALRIQVQGSYGNLVHELPSAAAPKRLRWAWRLQEPNVAVDLRAKAGDDAAVKVCMSFDMAPDRVPFMERQLLQLARARSGQDLPAATLCWVWAAAEAKGALMPNVYSRRVRYIVLRNRSDALATWFEESRDVAADFHRAFGDESAEPPPISALIVAGDGDNTGAASLAHVSGLRVEP